MGVIVLGKGVSLNEPRLIVKCFLEQLICGAISGVETMIFAVETSKQ